MNINCLIIDDDPFIKDLLKDKLEQFIPEINIVGTASSGAEGTREIMKKKPDLVFLDVEMDDMTGFEMLSKLDHISFETIFITSYVHYAIKAIRFNALDYLVKPIDLGELKQAVKRYKEKAKNNKAGSDVAQALVNIKTTKASEQKLTLQTHDGEMRFVLKDILRIEGERNYSYIILTNGKKRLASKTLGEFEEILSDKGFYRSHKSHIVNGLHIASVPRSGVILLSNGVEIPVARRKKEEFQNWFEAYEKDI